MKVGDNVKRNIKVGDNLSNNNLFLDFSNLTYSDLGKSTTNYYALQTDNGNAIRITSNNVIRNLVLYDGETEITLLSIDSEGIIYDNLANVELSENFGVVTSIEEDEITECITFDPDYGKVFAIADNMSMVQSLTKEQIEDQILLDSGVPKDAILDYEGEDIPTGYQEVGEWVDKIYPIGSIYMSVNSTDPSTLFGGTWERIQGKFLLGANDGVEEYNAGKMGGEVAHKLTVEEMPSHTHNPSDQGGSWVPATPYFSRIQIATGSSGKYIPAPDSAGMNGWKWGGTSSTGGGLEHNNMPPFLSVYIWKRTA